MPGTRENEGASLDQHRGERLGHSIEHGLKWSHRVSSWLLGGGFLSRDAGREVPRSVFHIQKHSELVSRLVKLEHRYRLGNPQSHVD